MKKFTAEDGTKFTFKFLEELCGCQRFEVAVPKLQKEETITLAGTNEEEHYDTLFIMFRWGMPSFDLLCKEKDTNLIG